MTFYSSHLEEWVIEETFRSLSSSSMCIAFHSLREYPHPGSFYGPLYFDITRRNIERLPKPKHKTQVQRKPWVYPHTPPHPHTNFLVSIMPAVLIIERLAQIQGQTQNTSPKEALFLIKCIFKIYWTKFLPSGLSNLVDVCSSDV